MRPHILHRNIQKIPIQQHQRITHYIILIQLCDRPARDIPKQKVAASTSLLESPRVFGLIGVRTRWVVRVLGNLSQSLELVKIGERRRSGSGGISVLRSLSELYKLPIDRWLDRVKVCDVFDETWGSLKKLLQYSVGKDLFLWMF